MNWGWTILVLAFIQITGCFDARHTDESLVLDSSVRDDANELPPIPPGTRLIDGCEHACQHLQMCESDSSVESCVSSCTSTFDTEILGCEEITLQALVCIPELACPGEASSAPDTTQTPCQDALNLAFVHCMSAHMPGHSGNGDPFR